MRKAIGIGGFGAIAIAVMFMLSATPMVGAAPTEDVEVDLIAGQNQVAGTVHVWHDTAFFYVDIKTTADWTLTETHVAMSVDTDPDDDICDLNGIPRNKNGSPKNGQFPYEPFAAGDHLVQYKISFTDVGYEGHNDDFILGEDEICIAVHAVVEKIVDGIVTEEQTGWGDGNKFTDKNWAMYFCYEPIAHKELSLPSTVTASIDHNGGTNDCDSWDCYWRTVISSGGSGNMPNSATGTYYLGWCIDLGVTISEGGHTFKVYAWYDTNMPSDEKTNHWNEINYFLNHKGDLTATELQHIIWYYSHETTSLTTHEQAHVTAGATDGSAAFIPWIGDWCAVLLQKEGNYQSIILEVDP